MYKNQDRSRNWERVPVPVAGNAIAKVCTIAYYQTVSLLLLVSSCKLQSWTKVWDTSVFLGRFPIHTGPTPPLTPQTMLDVCIQNFLRVSTLYRVGEENSKKIPKRCTVLRGNQEMREKYEYCSTVPRTWIVVIFSVKVSIFFLSYSKKLLLSIHM